MPTPEQLVDIWKAEQMGFNSRENLIKDDSELPDTGESIGTIEYKENENEMKVKIK